MTDEQKPPTDADLEELEADLHWKAAEGGAQEPPIVSAALALRLVAEVRRLRRLATDAEEGLRCALAITSPPPDISGRAMYDRAQAALALLIKAPRHALSDPALTLTPRSGVHFSQM